MSCVVVARPHPPFIRLPSQGGQCRLLMSSVATVATHVDVADCGCWAESKTATGSAVELEKKRREAVGRFVSRSDKIPREVGCLNALLKRYLDKR